VDSTGCFSLGWRCVCVCVCARERERERNHALQLQSTLALTHTLTSQELFINHRQKPFTLRENISSASLSARARQTPYAGNDGDLWKVS